VQLGRPDSSSINIKADKRAFRQSLKWALYVLALLWAITALDQLFSLHLTRFGLYPRSLSGLAGILFAPVLHSGWEHLISNSLPLLIGLSSILYIYPQAGKRALPIIYFVSSALAWVFARPSYHIGASGFIFGVLAFIFISGLLRRDLRSIAVSMMIWFLYASMIWGILPIREGSSWEMHLSGAITGVLLAFKYRHMDRIKLRKYSWEQEGEDEPPEWYLEAMAEEAENRSDEIEGIK